MMTKDLFYLESTPDGSRYMIAVNNDWLGCVLNYGGSWNILPARILGISYPDWLRFCRDEFGADINGKNSLYIAPKFKVNEHVRALVKLLNKRASIMKTDYNISQLAAQLGRSKNEESAQ